MVWYLCLHTFASLWLMFLSHNPVLLNLIWCKVSCHNAISDAKEQKILQENEKALREHKKKCFEWMLKCFRKTKSHLVVLYGEKKLNWDMFLHLQFLSISAWLFDFWTKSGPRKQKAWFVLQVIFPTFNTVWAGRLNHHEARHISKVFKRSPKLGWASKCWRFIVGSVLKRGCLLIRFIYWFPADQHILLL